MAFTWVSLFTNEDVTRSTFKTDLRTRIDEDAADILSDSQLNSLISSGLRDIARRTELLPEYCEQTPDGSESYDLPSGFVCIDEFQFKNSSGNWSDVLPSNLTEIEDKGIDQGTPEYYVRNGDKIKLSGYSSVTSGTLRIYGTRIPTIPTDDANYIDLPQQYLELLYSWCIWWYYTRRRNPDEAVYNRDFYLTQCQFVKEQVNKEFKRSGQVYG